MARWQEEEGLGKQSTKARKRKAVLPPVDEPDNNDAEAADAEAEDAEGDAHVEDGEDGGEEPEEEEDEDEAGEAFEPLDESLADELDSAAAGVNRKLREEQRKLIDSLDLTQYAVGGRDEDWQTALQRKRAAGVPAV